MSELLYKNVIPFAVALKDRATGTIYNIDRDDGTGLIITPLYVKQHGEYIYPPYPAFQEPDVTPPGVRIFVSSGVFGYELATHTGRGDPINNHTIFRDSVYELGVPSNWKFGDDLIGGKKL